MDIFNKEDSTDRQGLWLQLAKQSNYNAGNMAEICQISLRQLERYFEDDFSRSPLEWLTEQRMLAARHLLLQSQSVKEVAYSLSYKQTSHFCRDFKKCYEMTPTEFCIQLSFFLQ